MLRGFLTNSSGIFFSRIAGFVRDLTMSSVLGVGIFSDMFLIAFRVPNAFRRIFAEGAFSQAFLPSFSAARRKGAFVLHISFLFLAFILILCFCVVAFAPYVARVLAIGLSPDEVLIVAELIAINFWYLPLIFVVTLLGSLLQYKHNFTAAAYSTVLLNLAMIVALLLTKESDPFTIVKCLSIATLIGGILQILLHLYPLKRLGFFALLWVSFLHLRSKSAEVWHDVKQFYLQFFPALLGSSTVQIASLIDIQLASFLAVGSVSYLHYANRIFQLPLALFAIASSTALYPIVLRAIHNNNRIQALAHLKQSFWFLFWALSACSVGGMILSFEVVWILFERGNFSSNDSLQTGHVLAAYLVGLLPFGLSKIFSLWLYSHHQQMLAAKISIQSLLVGTCASLALMWDYGAVGLAIAGSLSGFASLYWSVKAFGFRQFWDIIADKKAWLLWSVVIVASAIAAFLMKWGLEQIYATYYASSLA
ncbi:MAG: murein biosynthesis integral membrane protein MurJ [Helicobacter sp.]|nr:murein biosynthesis integral membrane protein MurJ [Helicobacter sp.]